jgi:hypothetical protein
VTELAFLLDLLLNHRLPQATKVAITDRIKEVEKCLTFAPQKVGPVGHHSGPVPPQLANQAPSTIAALAKHPDLVAQMVPEPVAVIAQTPATAAALASREQAIQQAMSGKVEKGRTSPRKF